MRPDVRRARRAFLWVGVLAPAAITLLATIVVAVWLPQIPQPAATHWSGGGGPDGFGPRWTYLVLGLGVPAAVIALFSGLAFVSHRLPPSAPGGPEWSPTARFLGAANLGFAGMMATTTVTSVGAQRGLADAADAPDVTGWVFAGFGVMVVLGVAGWFLQPVVAGRTEAATDAVPLALAPGERAVWTATATTATVGRFVIAGLIFVMAGLAALLLALGEAAGWICAVLAVALLALSMTVLTFRVRVDADGLTVRSAAGWPRVRVPIGDVESVRAVQVNPFAEFGGWGLRLAVDGRFGVVLRTGDGIEVSRRGRRPFVVTVDDAATGAALLSALRTRGGGAATPTTGERRKNR